MGEPEGTGTATEAPLGEVELAPAPRLRSATPSYVELARVEGYGNPQTGELWIRAVPLVEGFQGFEVGGPRDQPAPSGVGVSAQALGRVPGYCEATYDADGVPNNNPDGTLEFYNQYDATGNAADQSSFDVGDCFGNLDAEFQTATHTALFTSQGVGCAYQHVGNFTGIDYNRLLLDVDVFNGSLATHGPYGPPFTTGTVVTPDGRNAPYQDLGLWDFGPMPSGSMGQTSGPHLKNMWVYFKNGDSNDFNWTGYILGEVFEECGDDDDDDCDGVDDNGCGEVAASDACFSDTDCASGHCDGASIVSGQGEGGGELGDDTAGTCSGPHAQVSAAYDTSCQIASNGVQCWGDAGDPTTTSEPSGTDHTQLSVGTYHACTLRADGQITCWGDNTDDRATSQPTPDHVAVSAGGFHNCALLRDGVVTCWGNNSVGQAPAFAGGDFAAVTAGYDFSCGLKHNGSIECWGDDTYSQTTPPVNDVFRSVSAGSWHACAIDADGDVHCWGDPAFTKLNAPEGPFTQVAAGLHHNCGVKDDGSLACWGSNTYGQTTAPVGTDYVSVTAGNNHSCAVKDDDSVVCWGRNNMGQTTVPAPPAGAALDFDGVDDQVSISHAGEFDFTTGTVQLWFKPGAGSAGEEAVASMRTDVNTSRWSLHINAANDTVGIHSTNLYETVPAGPINPGTWYQLTAVLRARPAASDLYLNGNYIGSVTTSMVTSHNNLPLVIGSTNDPAFPTEMFTGSIDEVRVWNRALSEAEIQSSYNCESAAGSMLANYHFNQGLAGSSNTGVNALTDSSPNDMGGTLQNFALSGSTSNWVAPGGATTGSVCTYGTVDNGFTTFHVQNSGHNNINAVATQPDGKVLFGGRNQIDGSTTDWNIYRLNTDGSLDTTWDSDGLVTYTPASRNMNTGVRCLAVQPDGKVIAVGSNNGGATIITRYNANGVVDTGFGTAGVTLTDFTANNDDPADCKLLSNGTIMVLVRSHTSGTRWDILLARYTSGGVLDTGFSGDGWNLISETTPRYANAFDVSEGAGKIVVVGMGSYSNSDIDSGGNHVGADSFTFLAGADLSTGALDTTFGGGGNGYNNVEIGASGKDAAQDAQYTADGKIVFTGWNFGASTYDGYIARTNANGTWDTGFAGGIVAVGDAGQQDQMYSVVQLGDGSFVVGGQRSDVASLRHVFANGVIDTAWASSGWLSNNFGYLYGYVRVMALDPMGGLICGGDLDVNNPDHGGFRVLP